MEERRFLSAVNNLRYEAKEFLALVGGELLQHEAAVLNLNLSQLCHEAKPDGGQFDVYGAAVCWSSLTDDVEVRSMNALQISRFLLLLISTSAAVDGIAQTCVPPSGFVDIPHPAIANSEELISHTEEITIERPLNETLDGFNKPLKDSIHTTSSLPGVSGDHMLTQGTFGTPGSRRLTCLTDGSTLEEEVLESERTANSFHFRYVVWNYTSESARPILYGVGDFSCSDIGGRTHVVWTYSFMLNRERFPGELGGVDGFFFAWVFWIDSMQT